MPKLKKQRTRKLFGFIPDIEPDDPNDPSGGPELHEHPARIVTREDWGAAEAQGQMEEFAELPVPYLVAMHTMTRRCNNKDECKRVVKEIQREHMAQGEPDILYNYLIDMEGNIYIGRGPTYVGMLYPEEDKKLSKANKKSINVGYIGSGGVEPSEVMIQGSASLTSRLFDGKYIDENLKFLWHTVRAKGVPIEAIENEEDPEEIRDYIDKVTRTMTDHREQPIV